MIREHLLQQENAIYTNSPPPGVDAGGGVGVPRSQGRWYRGGGGRRGLEMDLRMRGNTCVRRHAHARARARTHTHTHTHTRVCVCVCVCACQQANVNACAWTRSPELNLKCVYVSVRTSGGMIRGSCMPAPASGFRVCELVCVCVCVCGWVCVCVRSIGQSTGQ